MTAWTVLEIETMSPELINESSWSLEGRIEFWLLLMVMMGTEPEVVTWEVTAIAGLLGTEIAPERDEVIDWEVIEGPLVKAGVAPPRDPRVRVPEVFVVGVVWIELMNEEIAFCEEDVWEEDPALGTTTEAKEKVSS